MFFPDFAAPPCTYIEHFSREMAVLAPPAAAAVSGVAVLSQRCSLRASNFSWFAFLFLE